VGGAVHKLIYASCSVGPVERDVLRDILTVSRARNEEAGVTGLLLYSDESFLQLLEGDAAAVADTYSRIKADGRHDVMRLLVHGPSDARLFPDWSMGFEHIDADCLADDLGHARSSARPLGSSLVVADGGAAEAILLRYGAAHQGSTG
jgi:hypothetical protein